MLQSLAPESWSVDQQYGHPHIEMNTPDMSDQNLYFNRTQVTLTHISMWAAALYTFPCGSCQPNLSLNSCWDQQPLPLKAALSLGQLSCLKVFLSVKSKSACRDHPLGDATWNLTY